MFGTKLTPATRIIFMLLALFIVGLGVLVEIRMRSQVDDMVQGIGSKMTGSLETLSEEELDVLFESVNAKGEVYLSDDLENRLFEMVAPQGQTEEETEQE